MHSRLRTSSLVAWSIVLSVPPVSGFSQSDGHLRAALVRSSETVVRPYVAERTPSHDLAALPSNLTVADVYRSVVEEMRLRSPTFRRQCARIAAATSLAVVIEVDPPAMPHQSAAVTHFSRYQLGRMRAVIHVAISDRTPELIAHELEHVLEQLDGVDLAAKARTPSSGVHACCGSDDAFETSRAIATGQRVARELARE